MRNAEEEYFHDDPVDDSPSNNIFSKGRLKIKLAGLALVSALSYSLLGSTFATNISMSTGRVEFGQGITQVTACDNNVTLTPYATFANASGASANYKLTSIRLTDMGSGCWGKDIIIKVYNSTDSTPLNLYQTGGSTNYSQIRVYNDDGAFNLQDAGLTSSEISNITGGFQVTLFNSASPASTAQALASDIYKISIESVNHDSALTLVNLPSGSMNFVDNTYGLQYTSNSAFNFGTGNRFDWGRMYVRTGVTSRTGTVSRDPSPQSRVRAYSVRGLPAVAALGPVGACTAASVGVEPAAHGHAAAHAAQGAAAAHSHGHSA